MKGRRKLISIRISERAEKLKLKIRMLRTSLMGKWLVVCSFILVPIGIFSLITVSTIRDSYLQNTEQALQSMLDRFAIQTDYYNTNTQNEFVKEIVMSHMAELSGGSAVDSILTDVLLKEEIINVTYNPYSYAACFIYDSDRQLLTLFNAGEAIPEQVKNSIKKVVESAVDRRGDFVLLSDTEYSYGMSCYAFPYFAFGYIQNLDSMLEHCMEGGPEYGGAVRLVSADGVVIAQYSAAGGHPEHCIVLASSQLESIGYTIEYVIEKSNIGSMLPASLYLFYVLAILSLGSVPAAWLFAKKYIIRPLTKLAEAIASVESGNLGYRMNEDNGSWQMNYIAKAFNHMLGEINTMTIDAYEREIAELQTDAINAHLQVNQHMLLNSLNIVYSLVLTNRSEDALKFTELLVKYFRYAMRNNSPLVTVAEEMTFIEDFLRLQGVRYSGRFSSACETEKDAEKILIPQLLVHGFVENSLKYALCPDRKVNIRVTVGMENGRLSIRVTDDGNGIPPDILAQIKNGEPIEDHIGRHLGLRNARKRLQYYYENVFDFSINSVESVGTDIRIILPDAPLNREALTMRILERGWKSNDTTADC